MEVMPMDVQNHVVQKKNTEDMIGAGLMMVILNGIIVLIVIIVIKT